MVWIGITIGFFVGLIIGEIAGYVTGMFCTNRARDDDEDGTR